MTQINCSGTIFTGSRRRLASSSFTAAAQDELPSYVKNVVSIIEKGYPVDANYTQRKREKRH